MVDLSLLSAPFRGTQISWRVGATTKDKSKGLPLAYIDARDVMERLDEACGPANWQVKYSHAEKRVICEISIRVGEEWITKSNGAGDTDVEADKGAISDAFKRAAVLWGIGRYLYSLKANWVEIKPQGRSYVLTDRAKGDLVNLHERYVGGSVVPIGKQDKPPRRSKADSRDDYSAAQKAIDDAPDMAALVAAWKKHNPAIKTMPVDFEDKITQRKDDKKNELEKAAA